MINLKIENYQKQKEIWPAKGQHIIAQFTDDYVVVYQAYKPSIGKFATDNQCFGGDFSYSRMSWIKPNFLWMMYRSGWGMKEGQEMTLAIKLKREYFNSILKYAVPSSYSANSLYDNRSHWQKILKESNVRLQWDPDHSPQGTKEERRAIQLGLRNDFLQPFHGEGIVEIEDISNFVAEQKKYALSGKYDLLDTPFEKVYRPSDIENFSNVGLDEF